jgi:hypothetical protein
MAKTPDGEQDPGMKKAALAGVLILACLAASCNLFFSGNAGEDGSLSFSLGEGGAYTGVSGDPAAFGDVPGGYPVPGDNPSLGNPRIVVYDASGKALRNYDFAGDSSSWEFSVPAGGPYWVDFSAPVQHPADPASDPFPFVKSFGATVKLDAVEKGSSRELFLPLRVRETALMAPYMPGRTDVFVPFLDFPAEYPAASPGPFVDREGIIDLCLDFDPYGRLITTANRGGVLFPIFGVLTAETFDSEQHITNNLFSTTEALAFNLRDGNSYYTTSDVLRGGYSVNPVSETGFWESLGNTLSSLFSSGALASPLITTDEEGAFYVIQGNSIVRATGAGAVSFDIADIIDPAGQGWNDTTVSERKILDLKALNGYLYILLYIKDSSQVYNYFAALPLGAIKGENVRGAAWFAGGKSQAELSGSGSLAGFFEPKKIVGWGPERIYIYDISGDFHRTVEVDLRGRRISGAGLVLSR